MGLLDLFRPKWRHSKVEVRTDAVRALDADDAALAEVALKDPEAAIRRLAIKKIVDPELLEKIAGADSDEALRKAAAEKASALLISEAIADGDEAKSRDAVARLSSPKALAEVVKSATREAVWKVALSRLEDQKALADVARNARTVPARQAALARVMDPGVLRSVALNDKDEVMCLAAVSRLSDPSALEQIAQKSKQKSVRNAAKEKLAEVAPGREAPLSKQVTQKKSMQRQLCARAEAAVNHRDLAEAASEMEAVRDAWAELGPQSGDDELRVRFTKAVEKFEERRAQKPAAEKPAEKVVEKPAAEPAPPSAEQAEALAHEEAERAREQAERAQKQAERDAEKAKKRAEREARDAEEKARREARDAEKKQKQAEKESQRVANKEVWLHAATRLESLAASEDRAELEGALKAASEATDGARELPRDEETALRERYDAARKTLAIKVQELRELDRWKSWANVPKLEQLVTKMEALAAAQPKETEPTKETAAQLKALQAEWKAAGPAPKEKRDALWEKFKKAADEVYGRVKATHAQADTDRAANLTKKEELAARVEALADSTDFKETAETIKLLQEEWKAIGPVPKEKSDEVWKRFRGACDKFFERRKAHFGEVDASRDENLKKQEALLAKVEAVADSTMWKETAELIKEYQADWKEIGPGPKDKSDEVWKRFRAACDRFFERRKEHFAEEDARRAENLKKKLLLCEKAEALGETDEIDTIKALQAEWKTVGPAPKDQSDEVWNRFRAACDKVFDKKRKAEEAPLPAAEPTASATGVSGFTNKLPLANIAAELAAGWSDLAGTDDEKKK
jgi:hypothetical protein